MKKITCLLIVLQLFNLAKAQNLDNDYSDENFRKKREAEFEFFKDPSTNKINYDLIYKALQKRSIKSRTGSVLKWTEVGPKNVAGRVTELSFAKNLKPFAGGDMGGVWSNPGISTNLDWLQKTPDIYSYYNISSIATDPNNANIIYFATGKRFGNVTDKPGVGIFKSVDGGQSWNLIHVTDPSNNGNRTSYITKIKVANNGDVFVAASSIYPLTADTNGVFILNAANTTLTNVIGSDYQSIGFDIERSGNGDMWVSCLDDPNSATQRGIYRFTWNGIKWTKITQPAWGNLPANAIVSRIELACAPNDLNIVYALFAYGNTTVSVYKTFDAVSASGGSSHWYKCTNPQTMVSNFASQAVRDLAIVVDPNNKNTVYIGSFNVVRGDFVDSTANWTVINSSLAPHEDIANLVFYPSSSTELYACTDGGIYKCKNPATIPVWNYNSQNLNITQFNSCAMNNTANFNFIAGSQDNGTQWFKNASGISNSDQVGYGDGLNCFMGSKLTLISPDNLYKIILSNNVTSPNIEFRSGMHKDAFPSAPNFGCSNLMPSTTNTNPYAGDLDDENDVIIAQSTAGNLFFISNLNNTNCTSILTQLVSISGMSGTATCIKVSPESSSTVKRFYVGTSTGKLYFVTWTSGGSISATATDISGSLPSGQNIAGIDIRGANDNEIVVVYKNTGPTTINIFYANAFNATTPSAPSWTALESSGSSPIQGLPIRCVKFINSGANNTMNAKMVIGTEIGCYTTTNINGSSTLWVADDNGPDIPVTQLQYRPNSDGLLLMSTFGRGLWKSDTYMGYSLDFIPNKLGCQYQLTNISTGVPGIVEWDTNGDGIYDATGNTLGTCILTGASNIVTMRIGGPGGPSISKALVDVTPPPSPGIIYACCYGGGGGSAKLNSLDNEIILAPNPTAGLLNLSGDLINLANVEIYNSQGIKMKELKPKTNEISINEFSSGIYFFKFKFLNGTIKIIKIIKD